VTLMLAMALVLGGVAIGVTGARTGVSARGATAAGE